MAMDSALRSTPRNPHPSAARNPSTPDTTRPSEAIELFLERSDGGQRCLSVEPGAISERTDTPSDTPRASLSGDHRADVPDGLNCTEDSEGSVRWREVAVAATQNILSMATTTLPPLSRTSGAPSAVAINAASGENLFAPSDAVPPSYCNAESGTSTSDSPGERNAMGRSGTPETVCPSPTPTSRLYRADADITATAQLQQPPRENVPSSAVQPMLRRTPVSSNVDRHEERTPAGSSDNHTYASTREVLRVPLRQLSEEQLNSLAPAPTAAVCDRGAHCETFTIVATPVQQQLHDLHSALHDALHRTEQLRTQLNLEGNGSGGSAPISEGGQTLEDIALTTPGEAACSRLALTLRAVSSIVESAAVAADIERCRNEQRECITNDENSSVRFNERAIEDAGQHGCRAPHFGPAAPLLSPSDGSALIAPFGLEEP